MPSLSCVLWLIFLGAAFAGPLYWLVRRRRQEAARAPDAPPDPSSGILYLSPACMRALGTCAAPRRLRNMPVENIGRRIAHGVFTPKDPMPTPGQYGSWPKQATLLCAGEQEALKNLQKKLIEDEGAPKWVPSEPPPAPVPDTDRNNERFGLRRMLALMLVFLLLALLAYLMGDRCAAPPVVPCKRTTDPPPTCPTVVEESTINLSSDMLFDYNRHEAVHAAKAKEQLQAMLAHHDKIEILAIEGHTDPIGSTASNQDLGTKRAAHVRELLADLMQAPATRAQFVPSQQLPKPSGSGPNKDDFDIWKACYIAFQAPGAKGRVGPLEDLSPSMNDGRVPCRRATAATGESDGRYPGCTRLRLPKVGHPVPADYPRRAEQLREMIACLAPMRHVEIRFHSRRLVPIAAPPSTRSPE